MPRPAGKASRQVRSRGVLSNQGMDRTCGIMTLTLRRLLVVSGAGETPAKAPSPALGLCVSILPRSREPSPASPTNARQKNARRPPLYQRLTTCAFVSGSTARLGQERREGVLSLGQFA